MTEQSCHFKKQLRSINSCTAAVNELKTHNELKIKLFLLQRSHWTNAHLKLWLADQILLTRLISWDKTKLLSQ